MAFEADEVHCQQRSGERSDLHAVLAPDIALTAAIVLAMLSFVPVHVVGLSKC